MKLFVEHETHYQFAEPANHSVQYLRLTPRNDSCQRILSWTVTSSSHLTPWVDGFENSAHIALKKGPHDEVLVTVRGEVETWSTTGILPADDGLPPLIFLRETRFTLVTQSIERPAKPSNELIERDGRLAAMHDLTSRIADSVRYQSGFTNVETDADHALSQGVGVCQDHAHLFIASARVLNVPARYVSGYILAGSGNQSHLASHAWAEAYIDDLGWVSFDPTNRQSATEEYIRMAIGFDFASAGPVRGMREGGGIEEMDVRVQIEQSQS